MSAEGFEDLVEFFLEDGADVLEADVNGHTALHFAAAAAGNGGVVNSLLNCRADLSARDRNGCTPLHDAVN